MSAFCRDDCPSAGSPSPRCPRRCFQPGLLLAPRFPVLGLAPIPVLETQNPRQLSLTGVLNFEIVLRTGCFWQTLQRPTLPSLET